jgi:hypothetical protein
VILVAHAGEFGDPVCKQELNFGGVTKSGSASLSYPSNVSVNLASVHQTKEEKMWNQQQTTR